MDPYERCTGCHRGCYLSNPGCHVGRNMAYSMMYRQNDAYDYFPNDAYETERGAHWDAYDKRHEHHGHHYHDNVDYDYGRDVFEEEYDYRDEPNRFHDRSEHGYDERPFSHDERDASAHPDDDPHWHGSSGERDFPGFRENGRPPYDFRGGRDDRLPPHAHGRGGMRGSRRPPMGAPDDEFLIHSFHHCAHLLLHRPGREHGSSRAVMALERRGRDGMSQRELAESLDIRSASVSELLTKMEELGLITRRQDPHDKRVVLIELTEKGHEQARCVVARRKEENKNLFSVLDNNEKEQLKVILQKLTDFWHNEFGRENREKH